MYYAWGNNWTYSYQTKVELLDFMETMGLKIVDGGELKTMARLKCKRCGRRWYTADTSNKNPRCDYCEGKLETVKEGGNTK